MPIFIMSLSTGWLVKVNRDKKSKWVKKSSFKTSTGKTGVELRYYKYDEFAILGQEQKDELQDHRNSNGNYKGILSNKALGSVKYINGKVNYLTRAQFTSILKDHNSVK